VRIEGRLRQSDYEDKKTNEKVYTVDLHAYTFNRLAKKKET
jgi:single-stranded DNA-binding protein